MWTLKNIFLLNFFLLIFVQSFFSQEKQYTFNLPGNRCYFDYLVYAPHNDYNNFNKPFVFIIGEEGKSIKEVYNNDTIKDIPEFSNYSFVYVPNKGSSSSLKLYCLDALASLITFGYEYGHHNLFLMIKDESITYSDVELAKVDKIFEKVKIIQKPQENEYVDSEKFDLTNEFKETFEVENESDEEEFGVFYEEEVKEETDVIAKRKEKKKTYFGEPTVFNYTLTGVVKDVSTGETLPFTNLLVKGTGIGATTNIDGYFTLLKVPTDTNVIEVQYVGYEKELIYLSPKLPQKNLLITLTPSSSMLESVKVYGERQDVVLSNKQDVSSIKMTPKKIAQLPSLGEKDIMRSFQLMPGVSASNESSSGLYVRGGTPDQNLVVYDGFTVYHVDHLYGFFSAFNSNALKDVQLHKGGFASKFGGRLSSVTEITGKEGNQNKFNLGGDISLLSANVYAEVPIGDKFSSIIAFRKSYQGFLYNTIFDKFNGEDEETQQVGGGPGGRQAQETTVTSYFYDLNGKFTYKPSDKDIISLSIFNGIDNLNNSSSLNAPNIGTTETSISNSTTDLTKYGNIGTSLKWSRRWNDKLYGNTNLSYSNYFSDRDRSQERSVTDSTGETTTTNTGIFENNNLKDYSLKSDYKWSYSNFSQLEFGGFGTYYDIVYTYAQNDTTTVLDKDNKAFLLGGYVQNKLNLFKNRVTFLPGFRSSFYETTSQWYYEPRASLVFNLTEHITLKGATGKYYQFANRVTREDILSGSKDFWLLSDGNSVPVSSSIHYIGGISLDRNGYLLSAEGYYKTNDNLTEYSLRFNPSPDGVSYSENFFTGSSYSKGIEFLAQKKSGKLNGWLSYSIGEAKSNFSIYSDENYFSSQDVTHEFKAVGMYKYKRWDFSATWIFATGRPYTAPSGAYEVDLLDGTTETYFTVTDKNGLRLPNYHRLDLSANYKLLAGDKKDKRRREIGYLGFSIFNSYNRTNVWYKEFTIEDNEIIETDVNYLGFTPNLTLSLKIR